MSLSELLEGKISITDPCSKGRMIPNIFDHWVVDTCQCEFKIKPPFNYVRTIKRCKKHKCLGGEELFNYVVKENRMINQKRCKKRKERKPKE